MPLTRPQKDIWDDLIKELTVQCLESSFISILGLSHSCDDDGADTHPERDEDLLLSNWHSDCLAVFHSLQT